MSNLKRRDNKNRILRNGESQCKDGRYRLTFYENGKQRCLYSWKLERTDRLPEGKSSCIALREQIADYYKKVELGLHYSAGKITVYDLVDNYTRTRRNVRHSTQTGYKTVLNYLKTDPFSERKIDKIRTSDAKLWLIESRPRPKKEPTVSGIKGFLYLDKNEMPMVALHWEHYFKHIRQKYNKLYKDELPKITPHVCRHTYCSNMAKSGVNPKTLQYLMGHSDISVTFNTYTHIKFEDARDDLKRSKLI